MTSGPSIAVCIGTFGDVAEWGDLAVHRAGPSALRQTTRPNAVRWAHQPTLAEARNHCVEDLDADWLCFLDADDELDPNYIAAMTETVANLDGPALVQPATLGIHPDGHEDTHPVMIPPKPLLDGNYLVIGTLIRRDQFERVGGFDDLPMYEDWDLWIRAWLDGAAIARCPQAIYRVHVNLAGRNNGHRDVQLRTYSTIRAQYVGRNRRPQRS